MLIGYARVSTDEQTLSLQLDALEAAGCEKVFTDKLSGSRDDRLGLERAFEQLRDGDVLVVWRLDRLGRSLSNLIELMSQLEGRGIGFRSLTEQIDTTTPGGKLIFHIFGPWLSLSGISSASARWPAWLLLELEAGLVVGRRHSVPRKPSWHVPSMTTSPTPLPTSAPSWGSPGPPSGGI
jgi:hypothetical protein